MENDKKRTREMYENDTFGEYQYQESIVTPVNSLSSANGLTFNLGNSSGYTSGGRFGNSCGNNNGKDFAKWNEGENEDDEEWGVEGEDWEWEYDEGNEFETGFEETSDSQWNSYDNFEEEGYDSVG